MRWGCGGGVPPSGLRTWKGSAQPAQAWVPQHGGRHLTRARRTRAGRCTYCTPARGRPAKRVTRQTPGSITGSGPTESDVTVRGLGHIPLPGPDPGGYRAVMGLGAVAAQPAARALNDELASVVDQETT